ncbi:MAG: glycosyltransferase [Planctomycetota bacterium]
MNVSESVRKEHRSALEVPLHVLHVMEATIGGTRRHLVDVTLEQRRRGLRVGAVVSTLRDPGFPEDLARMEAAGVEVQRVPMVREIRPFTDAAHGRAIAGLVSYLQPDVVHTHSSKAGVLGRRASIRTGVGARVHTPHTFAFLFDALFSRPKRALIRRIERSLARRSHAVVAVSESERATIAASGVVPDELLHCAPNGIDPMPFEAAEPLDLGAFGLDPDLPTAAVVGLVYGAKGQDLAAKALRSAQTDGLQLLFVGPGELDRLRDECRALGIERRVAIVGARSDVPRVLASVDFLVLPSRWEGLPYVVLEAMAARLPVVATPVDGARDLVEDGRTGFLARSITADALGEALVRAVRAGRGRREELGRRGRERLDAGFNVPSMVDHLDAVYAAALERRGRIGA